VLIEPATTPQTETAEVSPPTVVEDRQDTPIAEPAGLAETSPPEVSQEEQEQPPDAGELPASQSAPMEPITAPAEPIAITDAPNLMLETVFEPFQGLVGYLVAALVVVVIVSIWLQLRAARQLRRAMGEMGQILDIVEDIYSEVALSHPSTPEPLPSIPAPNATAALPGPEVDFSPLERALLEGLSSGEEIQEGELAKMLQEKGFPGVLIKAVIGDIVRKTAGDGRPWVEVRFTHGRYAYALRLPGGTSEREARQGE
jgi:hypothetical protein